MLGYVKAGVSPDSDRVNTLTLMFIIIQIFKKQLILFYLLLATLIC